MHPPQRPPVKLSFFVPHLEVGGIEHVVVQLLRNLDRQRFEPSLILRDRRGPLLDRVPGDVRVLDLGGTPMRAAPRRLVAGTREIGTEVLYTGTNAANLAALAAFGMRRARPALVVSEHTAPRLYLAQARWPRPRRAAMRLLYPRADRVAVSLDEIGHELCDLLGRPDLPLCVLANPVIDAASAASIDPAPDAAWPEGEAPVFVAAGRLIPDKGFDTLLRAFGHLSDVRGDTRLLILGEGPERARLEALARDLGLADRVRLPGVVPDPLPFFRRAAAFVLSSRREGFGNALVEAMACGAPVVATDCPLSPRRILEEGRAGLLVPPDDPRALADGMATLLRDPGRAARLAERGRERAADFELSRTLPAFESLFFELAQGRRTARVSEPGSY